MFAFEKLKLDWSRIFPASTHFSFFLEQFFCCVFLDRAKKRTKILADFLKEEKENWWWDKQEIQVCIDTADEMSR